MSDKKQIHFFKPMDVGPREWGREILVAHIPGIAIGKLILQYAGKKGGLQKHHLKNESHFLAQGEMIVRYDAGDGTLTEKIIIAGESVHIPPGVVHQTEAITDCVIFETSTPHFNDRVRMEAYYGLPVSHGGLPSTNLEDVETR